MTSSMSSHATRHTVIGRGTRMTSRKMVIGSRLTTCQARPPTARCQVESERNRLTQYASERCRSSRLSFCHLPSPSIPSSVSHEISFSFFLLTRPQTHPLSFHLQFCMALTATPQSALPIVPSWDESIVPTLRKRASHISALFSLHHSPCPL
jgi:hypothetical protein